MDKNLLTVKNLSFSYCPEEKLLSGISLSIKSGEFISLIGTNGAGKSTLLKLICNRLKLDTGVIEILGKNIEKFSSKEMARELGYLEQFPGSSDLSVQEYILMGALPLFTSHRFWYSEKEKKRMKSLVQEFHLEKFQNKKMSEMSGGERQVVQICRSLMSEPKLLILDEPVSHLDIKHIEQVVKVLHRICQTKGVAVITSLHDLTLAYCCSDSIQLLNKSGRLIELSGDPEKDTLQLSSDFETEFSVINENGKGKKILVPTWDFKSAH